MPIAGSIMSKPKTKRLWGRDINIVKNGLDEEQVVELISELIIQRETAAVASFETPDRQDSSAKSDIAATGEVEVTAQPQVEANVPAPLPAPTEELLEQLVPEEEPSTEPAGDRLSEPADQALNDGDVELVLDAPVNMKMVADLYDQLQAIRELRIVRATGSRDQGIVITVRMERPIHLISLITSKLPGVRATPEVRPSGKSGKRISIPIPGQTNPELSRIKLASKGRATPVAPDSQ